jgi:predicted nucleic acid-binding protein
VTTYIDSSALVAVYVPERYSAAARTTLTRAPQVLYTLLHELEVANAFALLLGRRIITAAEHRAIGAQVRDDVEARRLVPTPLDWPQIFAGACELSHSCTPTLLTRSLDLLHVAAARALGCKVFVSADDRQLAAAKATGLKAVDIKRTTGRSPRR